MRIHNAMVAEQSHVVLDRFGHEVVGFYRSVERKLEEIGDENVSCHMDSLESGLLRALTGGRRNYLVVEHRRFREYSVLISARSHGTALHLAWMIMTAPRLVNDLRRVLRKDSASGTRFEIGAELDLFDLVDMQAFVGITRLALKYAIREVTNDKTDPDSLLLTFDSTE